MSEVKLVKGESFFTTKNMCLLAVFTAMSFVLYMFVKFPIPVLFPSFLDIQISDVPALLGGFLINPAAGCLIIVLKCLLKMPFSGTMYVGEVADILIGIAFVLPSSLIYMKKRTLKRAFVGLSVGLASSVVMSLIANAFVVIPAFVAINLGGNWDALLNSIRYLFPSITRANFYFFYLPLTVLPFNILRCFLSALITFLLYKKLSKAINYIFNKNKKQQNHIKSGS